MKQSGRQDSFFVKEKATWPIRLINGADAFW